MIRIKRIYDSPALHDGKRILVDRMWPRGLKKENAALDEWMKDLAPSNELRKWFGHDPVKWTEFKKKYKKEPRSKAEFIDRLRHEAKKKRLTLLFGAKDSHHNNAVALKEVLEHQKNNE